MKSKIVLFAFCLALLSGCGKKGFNMGGTPECAVETVQPTTVNLKSSYPATIKGNRISKSARRFPGLSLN